MTSPSPRDRLADPGDVLAKEPPDAKEFAGLVRSGMARLKDAENDENSLHSRFDLPYSAAHALRLAALRRHGFRPSKRVHRFSSAAGHSWPGSGGLASSVQVSRHAKYVINYDVEFRRVYPEQEHDDAPVDRMTVYEAVGTR